MLIKLGEDIDDEYEEELKKSCIKCLITDERCFDLWKDMLKNNIIASTELFIAIRQSDTFYSNMEIKNTLRKKLNEFLQIVEGLQDGSIKRHKSTTDEDLEELKSAIQVTIFVYIFLISKLGIR